VAPCARAKAARLLSMKTQALPLQVHSPAPDLERIDPRYRPVWEGRPTEQQRALYLYFLPHRSSQPALAPTRPRVLKWYCPFADQRTFPSGHRYCINVYTGCGHGCLYCYATAYAPAKPSPKPDFVRHLARDLADLDEFDVPPAPVHLANSTDPFQPLELTLGHTRQALNLLLRYRHRFTTVTLLTKNPALAATPDYLDLLRALGRLPSSHPMAAALAASGTPAVQVEVSLAMWREEARAFWEPGAPPVAHRLEGITALRAAGVPVVLRIDPLFPRSPLPLNPMKRLSDFDLVEAHTLAELEQLVRFARQVGVRHVVYSVAKIVTARDQGLRPPMRNLLEVYRALARPEPLVWRGRSWRLPQRVQHQLAKPFLGLCTRYGLEAKHCRTNLLQTA